MKVYAITLEGQDDFEILGVTLDEEVAQKIIKVHTDYNSCICLHVYDTKDIKKYTKPCWWIDYEKMTVRRCPPFEEEDYTDRLGRTFAGIVYADTEQHAIKIAGERKAKMLAERAGL